MLPSLSARARLVSALCPDYPSALCDLTDAPCLFRVCGELPVLTRALSIVGTRRADDEGLEFAFELARAAARAGFVVVSGGAVGIDRAAHEGAIEGDGLTLVVLPTGLDPPYPGRNYDLFVRVAEAGCLLTEVDDGCAPRRGRFLKRNRLVAALGQSTVVIQAPARSGALSTARLARGLGRRVFAVPASPWDPRGSGNLALLRKGARICAGPADVLSETAPQGEDLAPAQAGIQARVKNFINLTESQQIILEGLAGRPRHPDELCRRTGIPAFQVQQAIVELLVRGLVEERPGGRYRICRAGGKPY